MRVRMLSQECGPGGNFAPGAERIVADDVGRRMVSSGYAVEITQNPIEQAIAPPSESAVGVASESAVAPPVETRKQGKRGK